MVIIDFESIVTDDSTIPGTLALLQALFTRGERVMLIGNASEESLRKAAEKCHIANYVSEFKQKPINLKDTSMNAALISASPDLLKSAKDANLKSIGLRSQHTADISLDNLEDVQKILSFICISQNPQLDFSKLKTYSAQGRHNLVTIEGLLKPDKDPVPQWDADGFQELCDRIALARHQGRPVMLSMGAHVIKNNLSLYLIELMKRGIITHLSGNGACSIHDFELAYLGGTSEHVPTAIEDGSFGMWEETGRWMNEAIIQGANNGFGYGESLARYIDANSNRFPYRDSCVLYQAWKLGIPATYHVALGTDIIHQHPICDFGAIGIASGRDFHTYCHSLAQLDGGCYLNFGSGVIGPEVFLKALSISRNLGYQTFKITTANFDLIDLGDYRCKIGYEDPNYYYRPRKNIVNRPVSCGGKGWHFRGDHKETLTNLYNELRKRGF